MNRPRVRSHCTLPGHGMSCVVAWERGGNDFHFRSTEERMALEYEASAEYGSRHFPSAPSTEE